MMDYKEINKNSWNIRTEHHVQSDFYNVKAFLQCHFGLDTLSLARMGARVTGMDLSDRAIEEAQSLARIKPKVYNPLALDPLGLNLLPVPQNF